MYEYDSYGEPIESTLKVIRDTSESKLYYMNLIYTGNVFNAYPSDELDWNDTAKENGNRQNSDLYAPY